MQCSVLWNMIQEEKTLRFLTKYRKEIMTVNQKKTWKLKIHADIFIWIWRKTWTYHRIRTFWKGHKSLKQSPTWFDVYKVKVKSSGRFFEILWPSQNTWSLPFLSGLVHLLTRRMESLANCLTGSTVWIIWSMIFWWFY